MTDFGRSADSVAMERTLFADFAAVQAARQVGADVVIAATSGDAIVL